MAEEALQSIQALMVHIPVWLEDIHSIIRTSAERQLDAQSTYASPMPMILPLTTSTIALAPTSNLPCTPSATSLPQSRRSPPNATTSCPNLLRDSSGYMQDLHVVVPQDQRREHSTTLSDRARRLAQRARQSLSIRSGRSTTKPKKPTPPTPEPTATPTRAPVFYDGATQKDLETLVRALGASRNSLRKGKLSAKVDALSRICYSSGGDDDASEHSDLGADLDDLSAALPAFNTGGLRRSRHRRDDSLVFDRMDKLLENALVSSERAAFTHLRLGKCEAELQTVCSQLVDARMIAEAEEPRLVRAAERAAARQRVSEDGEQPGEVEAGDEDVFPNVAAEFHPLPLPTPPADYHGVPLGALLVPEEPLVASSPPLELDPEVDTEMTVAGERGLFPAPMWRDSRLEMLLSDKAAPGCRLAEVPCGLVTP